MGEACAWAAQPLLYRIRLMLMGAAEPVAQMSCGFVRCLPVEGHHGRGNAWNPGNMRPPALFGHPRHFDDEETASNSSFNAMPHVVLSNFEKLRMKSSGDSTYCGTRNKRNEVRRPEVFNIGRPLQTQSPHKFFFVVLCSTGNSPLIHRFSTRLRAAGFGDAGRRGRAGRGNAGILL